MNLRRAAPALLAALLLLGCGSSDSGPAPTVTARVPVDGSPQRGPSDAWVTVVEFGDFQCPYCRAEEPVVARVAASYPDDVRLVWKHLPLPMHPYAQPAAVAAECAHAQGRFWELHDLLLTSALDPASLLQDASAVPGLDVVAWQACLDSAPPNAAIQADVALATAARIPGTPTFVVNGVVLVGAVPEDQLRAAVAQARADAVASGVPRADYYDKVILGRTQ